MKRRYVFVEYFAPVLVNLFSSGFKYSLGLQSNGKAWGWGYNSLGQLGDNSTTSQLTPVAVLGATKTFCKIDGGYAHAIAIDKNGKGWGWGYNNYGQLGDNSITSKLTPVAVLGGTKTFCSISAGGNHTIAIDNNGKAWGWGWGYYGQLGNNSITATRQIPVAVLGATKTFCKISAAYRYTTSIDKNGQVWSWGWNYYGQLGNNASTQKNTPVSICGVKKTFCQIAGSNDHTLAIDKNGKVWGWGYNYYGQLGTNSTTQYSTPIAILGATKTFCKINGGSSFSIGLDKNGQVWCWGLNDFGQLGDNTNTSRKTPVSIKGATKTFCDITLGVNTSHSLGLDKNGKAWSWGYNDKGQLGNNSITSKKTPVMITTI